MPAYTMYTHTGTHTLIFPDRAGVKQALLLSGTCFGFAFQISLFFTSVRRRCGRGWGKGGKVTYHTHLMRAYAIRGRGGAG